MSAPARRLALFAATGAASLVVAYLVMVRTGFGQRLDDLAFEGRKATSLSARRSGTSLLDVATIWVLAVAGPLLVVRELLAGRRRSALAAVIALAGCIPLATLLKVVLPRPALYDHPNLGGANTFPSGHAAVSMVLVLVTVLVSRAPWRRRLTVVLAVVVANYGAAVVASGWHRPSDVAGGFALAMVVCGMTFACAFAASHRDRDGRGGRDGLAEPASGPVAHVMLAIGVAVASAGAAIVAIWVIGDPVRDDELWFDGFVLAVLVVALLGTSAVVSCAFAAAGSGSGRSSEPASAAPNEPR